MNKNELEERIKQAFEAEKPDLSSRLASECATVTQDDPILPETTAENKGARRAVIAPPIRRAVVAVICLVFFLSGFLVGRIPVGGPEPDPTPAAPVVDATVYVDVNPSISIEVDENDRVVSFAAENDDATAILADLDLDGVRLSTAISAVVGNLYINGYLSITSNSILVSVDSENGERTDALLGSLTEDINSVFENSELECSIIAQSVSVSDELREQASANGVSVGKMHLIDKMVGGIADLGEEDRTDLSGLSINELNLIYSNHRDEIDVPGGDKHSGNVGGYIGEEDLTDNILSHLGIGEDQIDNLDIRIGYINVNGDRRLVYRVSIAIIGDLKYRIVIDCENGEVLESRLVGSEDVGGGQSDDPPKSENASGELEGCTTAFQDKKQIKRWHGIPRVTFFSPNGRFVILNR